MVNEYMYIGRVVLVIFTACLLLRKLNLGFGPEGYIHVCSPSNSTLIEINGIYS